MNKTTRTLDPKYFYRGNFNDHNVPTKIFFSSQFRTKRFKGANSCGRISRAQRNATKELTLYEQELQRQIPSAIIVKVGWRNGTHKFKRSSGRYGSAKKCKGKVVAEFYIIYSLP